ncbi:hypothetical protein GDO81_014452 [Engystomops pustulosus]|uniref:Uncharacterized protein n=1 Tax=Engystomops pustulosus TaxID=76066 RepID=A0AAV7BAB4_ENGPU|nr:hypothetical protein GDO81_014452 [Engystomops pustulosus]
MDTIDKSVRTFYIQGYIYTFYIHINILYMLHMYTENYKVTQSSVYLVMGFSCVIWGAGQCPLFASSQHNTSPLNIHTPPPITLSYAA